MSRKLTQKQIQAHGTVQQLRLLGANATADAIERVYLKDWRAHMDAQALAEQMLEDPSLLEMLKEFCEGQFASNPRKFMYQLEVLRDNAAERLREPEGLDGKEIA